MVVATIENTIPEQFVGLFWKTFFSNKNRGVSVEHHFPWILDEVAPIWCVVLKDDEKVIGGLLVKECHLQRGGGSLTVGAIGLVCIEPEFRGCGYAKRLLSVAERESEERQYDALTLWTSKWSVYRKSGFVVHDETMFGCVHMYPIEQALNYEVVSVRPFPDGLGLPTFAVSGHLLVCNKSELFVVQNSYDEYIVVRWSGNVADVLMMIEHYLPTSFQLNAEKDDELVLLLRGRGAGVSLKPVNLQMWKVLNSKYELKLISHITNFDVLDRV